MKTKLKIILLLAATLSFSGCEKGYLGIVGVKLAGNGNYEYYTGAIPNSYYRQNYMGERAMMITGKPFMVVKYDRTSHEILDFEFGLSEVTQTVVGANPIPEPTLDAGSIDYHKKLNLVSPVVLLVNWPVTAWGETITNGSLDAGGVIFYYRAYGATYYTFSYLPAGSMTGGAVNLDGTGIETDSENSFNLLRQ